MKNFDFCDTIKVFKIRLFDISCKNKVYFHKLPGICTVLNNAKFRYCSLIIINCIKYKKIITILSYGPCNCTKLCKRS